MTPSILRKDHPQMAVVWIYPIALAIACAALSYTPGKSIWFDEFLQFAFVGYDSFGSFWRAFHASLSNINHDQTGAYFIANYILLKLFGASTFWMRFPSFLSSVFIFWSLLEFSRARKWHWFWTAFCVLFVFSNHWVMDYTAEARPYLPLAAAVSGSLAYFYGGRKSWLGWTSVIWGVCFHPFFFAYFLGLALASWITDRKKPPIALTAFTLIGTFLIAALTWYPKSPHQTRNPLEWMPHGTSVVRHLFSIHFEPLAKAKIFFPVIFLVVLFRQRKRRVKWLNDTLLAPSLIIIGALLTSCLLSAMAYFSRYWILERQWIASLTLIAPGTVWFLAETWRLLVQKLPRKRMQLALLGGVLLLPFFGEVAKTLHHRTSDYVRYAQTPSVHPERPEFDPQSASNDEWISLAQKNIEQGGPVWSVFRKYYQKALGF